LQLLMEMKINCDFMQEWSSKWLKALRCYRIIGSDNFSQKRQNLDQELTLTGRKLQIAIGPWSLTGVIVLLGGAIMVHISVNATWTH
jgi:hypothetical protein